MAFAPLSTHEPVYISYQTSLPAHWHNRTQLKTKHVLSAWRWQWYWHVINKYENCQCHSALYLNEERIIRSIVIAIMRELCIGSNRDCWSLDSKIGTECKSKNYFYVFLFRLIEINAFAICTASAVSKSFENDWYSNCIWF